MTHNSPSPRDPMLAAIAALVIALSPAPSLAGSYFVSRDNGARGNAADAASRLLTSRRLISHDGNMIAFVSNATNLCCALTDTNGAWDTYRSERKKSSVRLVSARHDMLIVTANGETTPRALSWDGRYVAVATLATNLVPGVNDSNGEVDAYLWDSRYSLFTLISHSAASGSTTANGATVPWRMAADGSWVLLQSTATDLGSGTVTDGNGGNDVFLWERASGQVRLLSRVPVTTPNTFIAGNGTSTPQALSADGRYVVFHSNATDLVQGGTDGNGEQDVFLYDRVADTVTLVSHAAGTPLVTANGRSDSAFSMSSDGRFVAYQSLANNLTGATATAGADVFVWDRHTSVNTLVSHAAANPEWEANAPSAVRAISGDGRYVLFDSSATDLVAAFTDNNGAGTDVYLGDRVNGAVTLISHLPTSLRVGGNGESVGRLISDDGLYVAFDSAATDLVAGITDVNGATDVFAWERSGSTVDLLSRKGASAQTANGATTAWGMNGSGAVVVMETLATDLVAGGADTNNGFDVIWANNPLSPELFRDGFEYGSWVGWSAVETEVNP